MKQRRKVSNVSKAKVMSHESNSASLSSVNNDWKHWLALNGDDKTVNNDVCELAHTVGLKFQGDKIICLICCLEREGKTLGTVEMGNRPVSCVGGRTGCRWCF